MMTLFHSLRDSRPAKLLGLDSTVIDLFARNFG